MAAKNAHILVVDDEKYICSIIEESLAADKHRVTTFTDPEAALRHIENNPVDLVLTDLVMGEYSGVQVLEKTLACHEDAVTILMTAHPTVQTAISVLKKGGYDFLVKPFKLEQLRAAIRRGLEHQRVRRDNLNLKSQVEFLKVVNAAGSGLELEKFLQMVVDFCRQEYSATAVGIIQVDPSTRDAVQRVFSAANSQAEKEVLDDATVLKFAYTRSHKPHMTVEPETLSDGKAGYKIYVSRPIFVRRRLHGVINLVLRTQSSEVTRGQLDALDILSNSVAAAIGNHRLYRHLQSSYLQAIHGLANAIDARDPYTAGHTDRVCEIAETLARFLGWNDAAIIDLNMGCTLHDIGKIGVPDSILNKPERLSDEEAAIMQSHPRVGLQIIDEIDLFKPAIPYIIAHHERWDGNGYPHGLKCNDIPIEGRLLAVVDCFDAILSDRPYREGGDLQTAVRELVDNAGSQFDPEIVKAFVHLLREGGIDLEDRYQGEYDLSALDKITLSEKAPA